jgi:hypothetical protein
MTWQAANNVNPERRAVSREYRTQSYIEGQVHGSFEPAKCYLATYFIYMY